MTVSLELSEADALLFESFAKQKGITTSELVRLSVVEQIEDECDLNAYKKALEEYMSDPVTYSIDEVEKELGST